MSVPVAYVTIIVIWSTTPIGITWSNDTVSPLMAVFSRMAISAFIGFLILKLANIKLEWNRIALQTYSCSLLGVYVALTCTYFAAKYVPSGLISVIYAMSPLMSTLIAKVLLGKGDLSRARLISFFISFAGLGVIFVDDLAVGQDGLLGLLLLLFAVFLYSLGGVLIQKIQYEAHPLSITVGTLVLALPFFFLTWLVFDGTIPNIDWASKAPWAIMYLAIFGSLIGFACYFLIVKELGATAVAMVTLMTPVIALAIGNLANNEVITPYMMIGTCLVLCGLLFYYFADEISFRIKRFNCKVRRDPT